MFSRTSKQYNEFYHAAWFILVLFLFFLISSGCEKKNSSNLPRLTPEDFFERALRYANHNERTRTDVQFLWKLLHYPALWMDKESNYVVDFEYYSVSEDILFSVEVVMDSEGRFKEIRRDQRFITGRFVPAGEKENGFYSPDIIQEHKKKQW